ncbi:unnamed protein product [Victoria cruziana]
MGFAKWIATAMEDGCPGVDFRQRLIGAHRGSSSVDFRGFAVSERVVAPERPMPTCTARASTIDTSGPCYFRSSSAVCLPSGLPPILRLATAVLCSAIATSGPPLSRARPPLSRSRLLLNHRRLRLVLVLRSAVVVLCSIIAASGPHSSSTQPPVLCSAASILCSTIAAFGTRSSSAELPVLCLAAGPLLSRNRPLLNHRCLRPTLVLCSAAGPCQSSAGMKVIFSSCYM